MEQITGVIPHLPPLAEFILAEGYYHQLGLVGGFRIAPSNPNRLQVELDFRAKAANGAKGPLDSRARFWGNLTQAQSLLASTLWGTQGYLASDGRAIEGYDVLPIKRTFSLGASPSYLAQIGTLFPKRSFQNSLLGAHPKAWLLVREEAKQRIVIPCFELLRTFYYLDGAKLMRFFFSQAPLDSVCQVLEKPTKANGGKASVAFVADGLTALQYCTLAELALNPAFNLTRQQTHDGLLGAALKNPVGTYPHVNFQLGRDIQVEATGFTFEAENINHFWVCAIRKHTPIWSFQHLEYETALDHRQNPAGTGTDAASPSGGAVGRPEPPELPTLTGELTGTSQSSGVKLELVLEATSTLPLMTHVPKEARPRRYPGERGYFKIIPSYFTYEGDSDSDAGDVPEKGPVKGDTSEGAPPVSMPEFFEAVVTWFADLEEFSVTKLTVNNSYNKYDYGTSVFPTWKPNAPDSYFTDAARKNPRRIAIARIEQEGRHFYFFQLLSGGRAALIFYKSFAVLEDAKINLLLERLADPECHFDWVKLRGAYGKDDKFKDLIGQGLEIQLRNHKRPAADVPDAAATAAAAAAALCEQELRRQLSLPKPKPQS